MRHYRKCYHRLNHAGNSTNSKAVDQDGDKPLELNDMLAAITWQTCGNYYRPIPNYRPERFPYPSSNPRQALINYGFHQTEGYACGQDPLSTCQNDYTRDRSYTGSFGTCDSPLFRDHGLALSGNYSIQFAEPSPEVFGKTWPYAGWIAYVRWWHERY